MDVMKLRLSTRFMKKIASKLLTRFIRNQLGYKVDIKLDELYVSVNDGETKILTSMEINLSNDELKKILSNLDEED